MAVRIGAKVEQEIASQVAGEARMRLLSNEDFLRWATGVGIGFDPRYPKSRCLRFLSIQKHARFWVLPDPTTWPHFLALSLNGLDDWDSGFLWPRSGRWPESASSRSNNEGVRNVLLRGAGVPGGWAGAVRFDRNEEDALVAVLYAHLAFGWCVEDDLFFVPDHGRQILQTDHHDVVHVQCASEERVQTLVEHLAAEGYELPLEPPDGTFKRQAWMTGAETDDARDGG